MGYGPHAVNLSLIERNVASPRHIATPQGPECHCRHRGPHKFLSSYEAINAGAQTDLDVHLMSENHGTTSRRASGRWFARP